MSLSITSLAGRVYRIGQTTLSKELAQLLISISVLIWTGVMVVSKLATTSEVMPLIYIVIGHVFGTQSATLRYDSRKPNP